MPRPSRNTIGLKFGRLLVVGQYLKKPESNAINRMMCLCLCDCQKDSKNPIFVEIRQSFLLNEHTKSCGCLRKDIARERDSGENNPKWKGGVIKRNLALYDTYAYQLDPIEECRRDPVNVEILQIQCSLCKCWFNPTITAVCHRVNCINGKAEGDSRFYCCEECKNQCSIFGRRTFPKGYKPESNRPYIDPYWREEVLNRADYKCEICGSEDDLEAHHIQSATLNPILANDPDNGLCCCGKHHDFIHSQSGCTTYDLRCKTNSIDD